MNVTAIGPMLPMVATNPEAAAGTQAPTRASQPAPVTQPRTQEASVHPGAKRDDPNAPEARQPAQKPATQPSNQAHSFTFTYEEGQRVMKVFDSKAVLIYQVPPKGRLQLLLLEQRGDAVQTSA